MKSVIKFILFFLFTTLLFQNCQKSEEKDKERIILPPEELYGELFYDVQSNKNIFTDSKYFVDAIPLSGINVIKTRYSDLKPKNDKSILDFIHQNFRLPLQETLYVTDSQNINDHIFKLWNHLKRPEDLDISGTLIPLPYPYIVPGGRFREIYYWDSYFTMLGLQVDNQIETIQSMVDNFTFLINKYGNIPNGNRTYYLSRSQPPFYALMINLLSQTKGNSILKKYIYPLEKEYAFWMNGSDKLNSDSIAIKRVVMLKDGEILNRYWDNKNTPRAESYFEDNQTAVEALVHLKNKKQEEVYRDIRAAAESGWDFSSRWLSKDSTNTYNLYSIHTTDLIPVDLNTLLYNIEYTLAESYKYIGHTVKADYYKKKYQSRKQAIQKYCWNPEKGFFMDYDFKKQSQTEIYSLAGLFPLFFQIADTTQTILVAKNIEQLFLKSGGVVTTTNQTNQQWDAPNGWAPLQWISIKGLRNYGQHALADTIKNRWLRLNKNVYDNTFKLLEKYNVVDLNAESGGGEYPTQDGFGWTNGVYQKLSKE